MKKGKVQTIEQIKISQDMVQKIKKNPALSELSKNASNPIKATLMKFVQYKASFSIKDLP